MGGRRERAGVDLPVKAEEHVDRSDEAEVFRVQELCESRGGRPGLPVLMSLTISVDVKQH